MFFFIVFLLYFSFGSPFGSISGCIFLTFLASVHILTKCFLLFRYFCSEQEFPGEWGFSPIPLANFIQWIWNRINTQPRHNGLVSHTSDLTSYGVIPSNILFGYNRKPSRMQPNKMRSTKHTHTQFACGILF